MAEKFVKKAASEKFAVGLKYKTPDLLVGETVIGVTVEINPEGLTTVGDPQISTNGREVSQMISGGNSGVNYEVLFKVTTSAGHIYNRPGKDSVLVKVV